MGGDGSGTAAVTAVRTAGTEALLGELEWRGILHATTPGLPRRLATGRSISGYIGFDPSGASLHVGHLVPIFGLIRLQRFGGRPVAVVGGGTGMIGDPSGRSSERNLLDAETLAANVASIQGQLERFLDFTPGSGAMLVNNLDWLGKLSLIEFLRDTGKHFTIPYMLAKDSVQVRLERGLSYTEFSYMLLQAYDFAHLHSALGVELQMGGADQWGNITAGLELIRRTSGGSATVESESAAGGADVAGEGGGGRSGPRPRVQAAAVAVGDEVRQERNRRIRVARPFAHVAICLLPVLAAHRRPRRRDVSALVHRAPSRGDRGARRGGGRPARGSRRADDTRPRHHGPNAWRRRRGTGDRGFRGAVFDRARSPIPSRSERCTSRRAGSRSSQEWLAAGTAVLLAEAGLSASRGEARRLIANGGVTVNGQRVTDPAFVPEPVAGEWLDVRLGKRRREIGRQVDADAPCVPRRLRQRQR